jgi:NADH dehydrogenase
MKVALIGGTGFIGSHLVDALLAAGHTPSLLVRPGSERKAHRHGECRIVPGEVSNEAALRDVVQDAAAVIYNIGILRESPGATFEDLQWRGVERTLQAAREGSVRHFLLMSAHGARADGRPYQRTKCLAERAVAASGMAFTIFRPSVVFGDPRGNDEIASRLLREMVRLPMPAMAFHTGWWPDARSVHMSPVHVHDVAAAFVAALRDPASIGQCIVLGGPESLSWKQMIERIALAVGRRKIFLPMPIGLMSVAATLLDRFAWFPVTRDQLTMLAQGNSADPAALATLIGRAPLAFAPANLGYLRQEAAR